MEIRVKIDLKKIKEKDIPSIFKLMNLPHTGEYMKDIVTLFGFIDLHYLGEDNDSDYETIKHLLKK